MSFSRKVYRAPRCTYNPIYVHWNLTSPQKWLRKPSLRHIEPTSILKEKSPVASKPYMSFLARYIVITESSHVHSVRTQAHPPKGKKKKKTMELRMLNASFWFGASWRWPVRSHHGLFRASVRSLGPFGRTKRENQQGTGNLHKPHSRGFAGERARDNPSSKNFTIGRPNIIMK